MDVHANGIGIGRVIARERGARAMTQGDLAAQLGVTKAAVSKWEQGASLPDVALLPRIASLFSLTLDELFDWSPQLDDAQVEAEARAVRETLARDVEEGLARAQTVASGHWSCWRALLAMATELLGAVTRPQVQPAAEDAAPTEAQRDCLLGEAVRLCERVEHSSGEARPVLDATMLHAAVLMQRGDFEGAIALVEPLVPQVESVLPEQLLMMHRAAGHERQAGELLERCVRNAVASIVVVAGVLQQEAESPEHVRGYLDAIVAVDGAFGEVLAGDARTAAIVPANEIATALRLVALGDLSGALELLERAAKGITCMRGDDDLLSGSPTFASYPEAAARTIYDGSLWGPLADDPGYQELVAKLRAEFGIEG